MSEPQYEALQKSPLPFICLICFQLKQKALIDDMKSQITALTAEVGELRNAMQLATTQQEVPPASSYASVVMRRGQRGQRPPSKPPTTVKAGALPPATSTGESSSVNVDLSSYSEPRVRVDGAHRVLGTMSHSTSQYVGNAISHFCNISGLKIRRETRSIDSGKTSWWFVIHADEAVLCELDTKWESVNLQTSWLLQSCSKPAFTIAEEDSHAGDFEGPLEGSRTGEAATYGTCPNAIASADTSPSLTTTL